MSQPSHYALREAGAHSPCNIAGLHMGVVNAPLCDKENIDTASATGQLVFHIFEALAEFERLGLLCPTR